MAINILGQVRVFFGYTSAASFAKDWKELSKADQEQIKAGIENSSLTY